MSGVRTVRVPVSGEVELHVLVDGEQAESRASFVLVHGLASNARLWDGVRAALVAAGHRVAAIDLRGHGLSDKPDDGYDFGTISADVLAVVDALGWASAVFAGQSWGGNVVLEVAARHPERTEAVVCVDGGWISLSRLGSWEAVRERLAPPHTEGTPVEVMEGYMRRAHPEWSDTAIAGTMACFEVRADGTVKPWLSRENHLTILRHLWAHDPTQLFPQVRTPVVLVPCDDGSGRIERKRAEVAEAERLLPNSRTVWFESSHDVHAERPADIAAVLEEAAGA